LLFPIAFLAAPADAREPAERSRGDEVACGATLSLPAWSNRVLVSGR